MPRHLLPSLFACSTPAAWRSSARRTAARVTVCCASIRCGRVAMKCVRCERRSARGRIQSACPLPARPACSFAQSVTTRLSCTPVAGVVGAAHAVQLRSGAPPALHRRVAAVRLGRRQQRVRSRCAAGSYHYLASSGIDNSRCITIIETGVSALAPHAAATSRGRRSTRTRVRPTNRGPRARLSPSWRATRSTPPDS